MRHERESQTKTKTTQVVWKVAAAQAAPQAMADVEIEKNRVLVVEQVLAAQLDRCAPSTQVR